MSSLQTTRITIAIAQVTPVWLDREATLAKVTDHVRQAGERGARLVCFGESLVPGYPFWLSLTHGSAFDDRIQKELHAHYLREAVQIERGDLDEVCAAAKQAACAVYLGVLERPGDRGGHSAYASLVYIDERGEIRSVHRKLQPTYEERLCWSPGDGNGLLTHALGAFTVGGLNCWENWMPLPRAALYAQGENLHVAVWPGTYRNTHDITPFLAKEGRSYSVAASTFMRREDIPRSIPQYDLIHAVAPEVLADGGSCVAAPDGSWLIEPVCGREELLTCELDLDRVYEERQNFDPSGHYSRPDVTRLDVNRRRLAIASFSEE